MKADFRCVGRDARSFRFLFPDFTFYIRAWVTALEKAGFIYCSFGVAVQRKRTCGSLNKEVTDNSFIMNASPLSRVPSFFRGK